MIKELIGPHESESDFVRRIYSTGKYSVFEVREHARKQALQRDIIALRERAMVADQREVIQDLITIVGRIALRP